MCLYFEQCIQVCTYLKFKLQKYLNIKQSNSVTSEYITPAMVLQLLQFTMYSDIPL